MSIGTAAAGAASSDGPATAASGTPKGSASSMLFDAILDKQNGADEDASQEIGDGVQPATERSTESAQVPLESSRVPFGAYLHGARGRLNLNLDVAPAAADAAKDEEDLANSVALLLTPFEVPPQPPLTDTRPLLDQAASSTTNPPDLGEIEQQLLQALLNVSADMPPTQATDQAESRLTKIVDAWIKAASESVQAEVVPADLISPRPAQGPPPAVTALVDAIRLSTNAGSSADRDAGSNQQAMTLGFDRSSGRVARAINLVQPVAFETTLGSAQAPATGAVTLPNEANVASSIVQSMRLQMRDGIGTALVHLEPDYLGAVSIALRVEGGVVTATLHADNPQVRAWIEANEPLLRQGLADQGLSLDRLLVSDERVAEDRSGRRRQFEQEPPARQKPRRGESSTFEVVV